MNQAIIFSKNRPLQLEALLSSIDYNAPKFDRIVVIYVSDEQYESGYKRLIDTWRINWHRQTGFKQDVLANIPDEGTTTFFVDDDIFYRKFEGKLPWDILKEQRNVFRYSFRLGKNINHSFTQGKDVFLPDISRTSDAMFFEMSATQDTDEFSYQFSLDGDCFKNEDIKWFMEKKEFDCPNEFEAEMTQIRLFLKPFARSAMPEKSFVVNVPHNKVQTWSGTTSMGGTQEELMDIFNQGKHIDWMNMDFSNVNSPHVPLNYKFR